MFPGGPSPSTLSALVSQHRLLELSRFGLRGYDLAQHMLTQQGAVSKLLGKCSFVISIFIIFIFDGTVIILTTKQFVIAFTKLPLIADVLFLFEVFFLMVFSFC